MKIIIISLLLFLSVNAQNVYYVDYYTPAGESGDGASWATAYKYLGNLGGNGTYGAVHWHELSGGDTVYVAGYGSDTLLYPRHVGQAHYVGSGQDTVITYTGNPVIVCPAKLSGRTTGDWATRIQDVYLTCFDDASTDRGILQIDNIVNVEVKGFALYDIRTPISSPSPLLSIYGSDVHTDPPNIFENNYLYSAGWSTGMGYHGYNVIIRNNYYEELATESVVANDPFGGTGGMGTIIDGNTVILRNTYTATPNMTANDSVIITDTSLIDLRLSALADANPTRYKLIEDYHLGIDLRVNENWSLIITSSLDSLFIGTDGWTFTGRSEVADAGVVFTSTSMADNNATTFTDDVYINTTVFARLGTDTIARMVVTDNIGSTLYGIKWVDGNGDSTTTPTTGIHGYIIGIEAGDSPPQGCAWRMEGGHRDGLQFSAFYNTPISDTLTTIIRNNIIVDEGVYGTGWNGIIYTSNINAHQRWLVYNNIFVSKQEISSSGIFMYNSQDENNYPTPVIWESMKFFNNTLIFKGSGALDSEGNYTGTGFYSLESFDSLEIKNNLFVCDTTMGSLARYDKPTGYSIDIDYNIYAFDAYNLDRFGFDQTAYRTLTYWRSTLGLDVNSDTLQSSTVTFANKYGTTAGDYLTTTGRDSGVDLSADYPYLSTDILGNPRTGTWDVGALEYQAPVVITNRRNRVVIIR